MEPEKPAEAEATEGEAGSETEVDVEKAAADGEAKEGEDKKEAFETLAEGIRRLSKSQKKLTGLFVKDFKNESLYITKHLDKYGYRPMQVEPNMIINLKSEWLTFEDYKKALKSSGMKKTSLYSSKTFK